MKVLGMFGGVCIFIQIKIFRLRLIIEFRLLFFSVTNVIYFRGIFLQLFLVQTQMTGTSVVFSLSEGEMSRIWYQNDQLYPNSLNK